MSELIFKRYEMKYLLTTEQYKAVRAVIEKELEPDHYPEYTIQSLYFDTANDLLIRNSIEGTGYKEKLRLRCYGLNGGDSDVFLEMKRKYKGEVYKRRISVKEDRAEGFLQDGNAPAAADPSATFVDLQIARELRYFSAFYRNLRPKVLLIYDRSAFHDPGSSLRVTFDRNIRYRTEDLNLHTSLSGKPLLLKERVLMEIKTGEPYPFWLCRMLEQETVRKTSFSKYGQAYKNEQSKLIGNMNQVYIGGQQQCLKPFLQTEM